MSLRRAAVNGLMDLHRGLFRLSGARLAGGIFGMPVLELTTTGAKSGKSRSVMLTSPITHEGNPVIVASMGGDPRSPSWYHNLVANPDVTVTLRGKTGPMRARVVAPEERAELWPRVVESYSGYGGYQEKTTRVIPLVVLEPPG
jgi:deazaflavin-dependent oxidoreductase (nitroreductase family)